MVDTHLLCTFDCGYYDLFLKAGSKIRKKELHYILKEKKWKIIHIISKGLNKKKFYGTIRRRGKKASIVTLIGHGPIDGSSCGYPGGTFFQVYPVISIHNADLPSLSRKIIHIFACHCAKRLGIRLIQLGNIAFFGYNGFLAIPNEQFTRIFFLCDLEIEKGFAMGKNALEVANQVEEKFRTEINNYKMARMPVEAGFLQDNMFKFRSPKNGRQWGDINARI